MKILITGNLGYVGPRVIRRLRQTYPSGTLVGYDMGYFADCLTGPAVFPECMPDIQYFGDVRTLPDDVLGGIDAVVHLAAISNDPMGASFEEVTYEINYRATVDVARKAKRAGVRTFVLASSCSVYGSAAQGARTEEDPVNPLTAYAKSKVMAERDLAELADEAFTVTCLRFATACGMSERLRLDLVLNDFVASAISHGAITILSDGTPWRPLIHVDDMARAIDWAVQREPSSGGVFLAVNAGSDQWNYRIRDLADAVAKIMPGIKVTVHPEAQPDRRSYQVSFARFRTLAPAHQPDRTLIGTILDLKNGLEAMAFRDQQFRRSNLIRLNTLQHLKRTNLLTDALEWAWPCGAAVHRAPDGEQATVSGGRT